MHQSSSSLTGPSSRSAPTPSQPRLHGSWLVCARAVWATVALLCLAFFLANLPVYFAQLYTVCLHPLCAPWQLSPASATTLQQLHLSASLYALVSLVVGVASSLVWFAVAAIIFWRQSQQWMALLTSLLLVVLGTIQISGGRWAPLEYSAPVWQLPTVIVGTLALSLYPLVFSLFPTGRFVPGWMRWLVAGAMPVLWAFCFFTPIWAPDAALLPLTGGFLLGAIAFVGMIGSVIGAQIYRYRRVSTWVERQQTKWVVLGIIEGPLVGALFFLPPLVFPTLSQPDSLYFALAKLGYNMLFLFAPLSIGIAILRYRLWDIDTIINKALVYGSLTALLTGVYAGLILGLESLAGLFGAQATSNPLVLVISTLAIAALFLPVRQRIQTIIDRRFYRRKYDAEQTLAAFSATLRHEVDLEQIRVQLLAAVHETMQPEHVSLWLRAPERQMPQEAWRGTDKRARAISQWPLNPASAVD